MATVADVRRIALGLPRTTEKPSYGTPGFRVADTLFARLRDDDETLVAWVGSEEEKAELIASAPETYFTTSHYDGYPSVLVRLAAIDAAELSEILTEAWRVRAPRKLVAEHSGG